MKFNKSIEYSRKKIKAIIAANDKETFATDNYNSLGFEKKKK